MSSYAITEAVLAHLDAGPARPARPELLPVEAIREARSWVSDPRKFYAKHAQSWRSALADALAAIELIGPAVEDALGSRLVDAEQALRNLLLDLVGENGPAANDRLVGRWAADSLLLGFRDPTVGTAAWDDLVAAAGDPGVDLDDIEWRERALREILEFAGVDYGDFVRSAHGILQDGALETAIALSRLRGPSPPPDGWPSPSDDAGLSQADQLDLCRRLLQVPALIGHQVVWLAFADASLERVQLDCGPVMLFDGAWMRALLAHPEQHSYGELPAELTNPSNQGEPLWPEGDHIILARVDLAVRPASGSVAAARRLAMSVVATAHLRLPSNR